MLKTFKGGVYPDGNKALSSQQSIEIMPTPSVVHIPLVQHSGQPALPVVKPGDQVVIGQLIGKAASKKSCNVFSSCCGTVKAIEERVHQKGKCKHIVIENNGQTDNAHLPPLESPTSAEIIQRVADCGICGMGGAGYPTANKLSSGYQIDDLLINGTECEPYITCDHRIMLQYTNQFLDGVGLLRTALDAKRVIIGVEDNKQDAILAIKEALDKNNINNISVVALKTKYPQGADRQLIYSLIGKKVPKGERSAKHGVAVFNVHTALSVHQAVREGRQSYARVITVTGGSVKNPKNLWVSTGTTFNDVINYCGGTHEHNPPIKVICGGPMMGVAVYTTEVTVAKNTSCILLLGSGEIAHHKQSPCINCGKCAQVCPMKLMPMNIDAYSQVDNFEEAQKWGAEYCIECGSCSFICPAKRHLVQSIVLAKSKIGGKR